MSQHAESSPAAIAVDEVAERDARSGYIPTLDGWRAIAILMVILAHMRFRVFGTGGIYPNATIEEELSHFVIGVPIFFGISGLLIGSRLLDEQRLRGAIDVRGFYVRRALRILPPYLLALVAIALLAAWSGVDVATSDLRACLFFYRNYVHGENVASWYTDHFWSLAVEEHFYLLLPAILVLFEPRRALRVLLVLAAAVMAWRAAQRHLPIVTEEMRFLTWRTDLRLDGLLLGAAAAFVLLSNDACRVLRPWLRPAVVVALLVSLEIAPWIQLPSIHTFIALVVPFILLGTILHHESPLGRFLEWAPLRWIGRISYSLYLWQQIFFTPIQAPFTTIDVPGIVPEWLRSFPWDVPAVFACACASYYLVERPLTRIGRKLARPATSGRA